MDSRLVTFIFCLLSSYILPDLHAQIKLGEPVSHSLQVIDSGRIQFDPLPIWQQPEKEFRGLDQEVQLNVEPVEVSFNAPINPLIAKKSIVAPDTLDVRYPATIEAGDMIQRENALYNIHYMDEDQGLLSPYIWAVVQDPLDNFWFGSFGSGVFRYDGGYLQNYTSEEGLISDFVQVLYVDQQQLLWLGTSDGLMIYDGLHWLSIRKDQGLPSANIWEILEDDAGGIWVSLDKGVVKFEINNGQISLSDYSQNKGLSYNNTAMYKDETGDIWVGNSFELVKIFSQQGANIDSYQRISKQSGIPLETIWSIVSDEKGELWLGTNANGAIHLDLNFDGEDIQGSYRHYYSENGFFSDWIWDIYRDSRGDIWFGSYSDGLAKLETNDDKDVFSLYHTTNGLSNDYVQSIHEDQFGNLWMGTYGGGVNRFDRNAVFENVTTVDGMINMSVVDILKTADGDLWFSTDGGGLIQLTSQAGEEVFLQYSTETGLMDEFVWTAYESRDGAIWFSSSMSLSRMTLQPDGMTIQSLEEVAIQGRESYLAEAAIYEDQKGQIWVASYDGLYVIDPKTSSWKLMKCSGIALDQIYEFKESSEGRVWLITYGHGLLELIPDGNDYELDQYGPEQGLSSEYLVTAIELDNRLLLGTEGLGLNIVDIEAASIVYVNEQNGLSSDYVWSLVSDIRGHIWAGTDHGLNELIPDPQTQGFEIKQYYKEHGLKSRDFEISSSIADDQNRVWWGGGKSLSLIDLNQRYGNYAKPTVHLSGIKISDKHIDFSTWADHEDLLIQKTAVSSSNPGPFRLWPEDLRLPYELDHLTFLFSGQDDTPSNALLFQYRLVGLETDWSTPSESSTADFRNLDYGQYSFEFKAQSVNQVWSDVVSYPFVIVRPWWHTWWARGLFLMTFVLGFAGLLRLRTLQLQEENSKLEQMVAQRTSELTTSNEELKSAYNNLKHTQDKLIQSEKMASLGMLSAGIAHEINNPVSAVYSGAEVLVRDVDDLQVLLDHYSMLEEKYALNSGSNSIAQVKEQIDFEELVQSIRDTTEHLQMGARRTAEIIKDLQMFSRADEENMVPGNIHESIDLTLSLLGNKLREIEIIKHYDSNVGITDCYFGLLNQVFMNLFSNAIDAMPDGGVLMVQTEHRDHEIGMTIKDTGTGVPRKIQSRVFDPFFTTKEVGKGTGLGLSICYRIIEKHNGTIELSSEPGQGTTIRMSIPYQSVT